MIEPNEYTFDLLKILFGEYNLLIYVEIIIRVLIILSYTMLIINWIGKRVVGGLGSADILIVVGMGSAVGDSMFYPSIPLTVAILVITLIGALQKVYVYLSIKSESVRKKTHPKVIKLVESGRLLYDNFSDDQIDKYEVYMLLRESGIKYLSEVEHAYYEQSGKLSIYKYENPILEHSILPEHLPNHEKFPHKSK
ncbi:DUF421 domain-containing protein [Formosa sp. 4Alg 33]|uniref:DUF421 domain-containing protein n=1 Tax=Formosa sp. 4Alg 33 TaxID=3382189 RepID=UPI003D9C4AE8